MIATTPDIQQAVPHETTCPYCEFTYRLSLDPAGLALWRSGLSPAQAFPRMSPPLLNLLTHNVCPSCMNTLTDPAPRPISIGELVPCPTCEGRGFTPELGLADPAADIHVACNTCAGTGEVLLKQVCHECQGEGSIIVDNRRRVCFLCNGEGVLW